MSSSAWLSDALGEWSGLLGFAALVFALYYMGGGNGNNNNDAAHRAQRDRQGGADRERREMGAAATTNAGATTQDARQAAGGVETAVGRVRRMTVATVGVLFRADASKPLNARDGASLIPAAERAIRAAAAQGLELFLITHVDSDAAQESAQKSLKSSGISGTAIPPHRCLFCDTDVGRTALVRQLEPDVHVDAGLASVTELARFLPRVAHVVSTGSASSTVGKNVTSCAGLAELLLTS